MEVRIKSIHFDASEKLEGFINKKLEKLARRNEEITLAEVTLKVVKPETVKNKRVILIDDSIVRGTTSRRIVRLLREAGAKEVHMRVSSPPFRYPCFFGTDVDSRENLIACRLSTDDEIAREIGADSLAYLSVESAHRISGDDAGIFCDGCFTGVYPIAIPAGQGKNRFEQHIHR